MSVYIEKRPQSYPYAPVSHTHTYKHTHTHTYTNLQKFTGNEGLHYAAAWTLMLCAFIAFYCWAHVLYVEVFEDDILPMGAPLWTGKVAWKK
jgi:hypothetical protein